MLAYNDRYCKKLPAEADCLDVVIKPKKQAERKNAHR